MRIILGQKLECQFHIMSNPLQIRTIYFASEVVTEDIFPWKIPPPLSRKIARLFGLPYTKKLHYLRVSKPWKLLIQRV